MSQKAVAQNASYYVDLGEIVTFRNNKVNIGAYGTANGLENILINSSWMYKKSIKIPKAFLFEAKESISFIESRFDKLCTLVKNDPESFKGTRRDFSVTNRVFTSHNYNWSSHPENLKFKFFVSLKGEPLLEVWVTVGNSQEHCFYLTSEGVKEFSRIIKNAENFYLSSPSLKRDKELDRLMK